MALITCPECGKEVSDTANNCPNCGYPIAQKKLQIILFRLQLPVMPQRKNFL